MSIGLSKVIKRESPNQIDDEIMDAYYWTC